VSDKTKPSQGDALIFSGAVLVVVAVWLLASWEWAMLVEGLFLLLAGVVKALNE
jgi:hypothetical protein